MIRARPGLPLTGSAAGGVNGTVVLAPAAAGRTDINTFSTTASGVADAPLSDVRLYFNRLTFDGANDFDRGYNQYNGVDITATSNSITQIYNLHNYVANRGTPTVAQSDAVFTHHRTDSSGGFSVANNYTSGSTLWNGTGSIGQISGFVSGDIGHATRAGLVRQFVAGNTSGAQVYGFYSIVLAGSNKWGFFDVGGANNAFKGSTIFGLADGTTPLAKVDIREVSNAAITAPLLLKNGGTETAGTGVEMRLAPRDEARSANIRATTDGLNAITLDFLVSSANPPALAMRIKPDKSVEFSTSGIQIAQGSSPGAPAANNVRLLVDAQGSQNGLVAQFSDGLTKRIVTQDGSPRTITASTDGVADQDTYLICNRAGTVTLTLPTASSHPGRRLMIKTITANTVVSASSNVVPRAGGAAGTAILAAAAGNWSELTSDATNWVVMAGS